MQIYLVGHIYNIDVGARQIQISWQPLGCGGFMQDNTAASYYNIPNCGRLGTPTNFFLDG